MIPQYSVFLAICNPTVSLIGAFLSILIIVILSNKGFKEIFYVYLKFQAYFTLFNLLIKIFQPLYYCADKCEVSKEEFVQYYHVGFIVYASSICEMVSQYSSVLSGLYCCLFIWEPSSIIRSFLKLLSHYLMVIVLLVIFSALIFSFQLFEWTIIPLENQTHKYESHYDSPKAVHSLYIIANSVRDLVSLIALVIINVVLWYKLRKIMEVKLFLMNLNLLKKVGINNKLDIFDRTASTNDFQKRISNVNESNQIKINKIKRKQIITILSICLNSLFGRFPILGVYLKETFQDKIERIDNSLWFGIAAFLVYVTNCLAFFILYFCNERFKRTFNKYFKVIILRKE